MGGVWMMDFEERLQAMESKLAMQEKKSERFANQLSQIMHEQTNLVAAIKEKATAAVHASHAFERLAMALEAATMRANDSGGSRKGD